MKTILSLFLVIAITGARASNYYLSSSLGDDAHTPLEAKSPSTPWKTLDKLNAVFPTLQPGDSILLKRGETFYGSIVINKSGTLKSPIVIGAYGLGSKPVITGFVPLVLAPLGNNVYESQALTPAALNVLVVNGELQAMGRYPNSGYLSFEAHSGINSITDNELAGTPNWTGAELVLRSRRWVIDRDLITGHAGKTISYTAASRYEPKDKYGYFIQNSPLTLDEQGEWYYNPTTKKVWLFSTSAPKNVTVAIIDNLVSSTGSSNVIFAGIKFQGANKNGVNISSGSNIHLVSCEISYSGENGVKVNNHSGFKLENCNILNSLNNGVDLGPNAANAVLTNNLVKNTAVLPGMGLSADKRGIGIYSTSNNNFIAYNRVINSGYAGIYFGGDSTIIQNNFIDSFCSVKDDGGGIYTYIGAGAPRTGRKITGNIILNGMGAPEGTDNPKQLAATGIYLDDNSTNIDIRNNTVANCGNQGIFIQNTTSVVVANNTFFDNHVQISLIERPNKLVRNNTITQNIFFSTGSDQMGSFYLSAADDVDQFAKFDSNYYAKPLDNNLVIYNGITNAVNNGTPNAELKSWKQKYGREENVRGAVNAVAGKTNYAVKFEYNSTNTAKTVALDGSYADLKNNKYVNSVVLKPFSSVVLVKQK